MMQVPGYWMNETSGVLRPAVEAYLFQRELTVEHIGALRAYLRQWMAAPAWTGPEVETLRSSIDGIASRKDLRKWFDLAEEIGIDPL